MRRREAGRGESQETRRVKSRQKGQVTKMAELYREGQLGESSPTPGLEEVRVGSTVCQPHPVTGRDWGVLGEPGGQVYLIC